LFDVEKLPEMTKVRGVILESRVLVK